jgi:hypothetical protein
MLRRLRACLLCWSWASKTMLVVSFSGITFSKVSTAEHTMTIYQHSTQESLLAMHCIVQLPLSGRQVLHATDPPAHSACKRENSTAWRFLQRMQPCVIHLSQSGMKPLHLSSYLGFTRKVIIPYDRLALLTRYRLLLWTVNSQWLHGTNTFQDAWLSLNFVVYNNFRESLASSFSSNGEVKWSVGIYFRLPRNSG